MSAPKRPGGLYSQPPSSFLQSSANQFMRRLSSGFRSRFNSSSRVHTRSSSSDTESRMSRDMSSDNLALTSHSSHDPTRKHKYSASQPAIASSGSSKDATPPVASRPPATSPTTPSTPASSPLTPPVLPQQAPMPSPRLPPPHLGSLPPSRMASLPPAPPILSPVISPAAQTPRLRLAPTIMRRPESLPLERMPSLAQLMERPRPANPRARDSLRAVPQLAIIEGATAPDIEEDAESDDDGSDELAPSSSVYFEPAPTEQPEETQPTIVVPAATVDSDGEDDPTPIRSTLTLAVPGPRSPAFAQRLEETSNAKGKGRAAPQDGDYFSRHPNASASSTPRVVSTPRPGMSRQFSRSMVDLAAPAPPGTRSDISPHTGADTSATETSARLSPSTTMKRDPSPPPRPRALRRRSSMPAVLPPPPHRAPPPYASTGPTSEDGHEALPEYSNDLLLRALLPRKMEFSAPGVLAKDRRWKRVWVVLEGTALRIYRDRGGMTLRPPSSSSGEKSHRIYGTKSGASSSTFFSHKGHGQSRSASRDGRASPRPSTPRPSTDSMLDLPSASKALFSASGALLPSLADAPPAPERPSGWLVQTHAPDLRAPLRVYTMQRAESGLGSDYVKRRHVIRVRAEGEQFLVQMGGVAEVVRWVEAFQAAANIALDLDERVMPRGPLYPRRRRRRRPRPEGEAAAPTEAR